MDGPEVSPSTCLEVSPQPDENMYYIGGGVSKDIVLDHLDRASLSQAGGLARFKPIWTLAGITVICLAVALGTGLGAGVAIRSFFELIQVSPCF